MCFAPQWRALFNISTSKSAPTLRCFVVNSTHGRLIFPSRLLTTPPWSLSGATPSNEWINARSSRMLICSFRSKAYAWAACQSHLEGSILLRGKESGPKRLPRSSLTSDPLNACLRIKTHDQPRAQLLFAFQQLFIRWELLQKLLELTHCDFAGQYDLIFITFSLHPLGVWENITYRPLWLWRSLNRLNISSHDLLAANQSLQAHLANANSKRLAAVFVWNEFSRAAHLMSSAAVTWASPSGDFLHVAAV